MTAKSRYQSEIIKSGMYNLQFQLVESKWASELSSLQETQKREYRNWVMKVYEDTQTTEATPAYV